VSSSAADKRFRLSLRASNTMRNVVARAGYDSQADDAVLASYVAAMGRMAFRSSDGVGEKTMIEVERFIESYGHQWPRPKKYEVEPMTFSVSDKRKCAERELVMRLRVYERHVAAGKMKPEVAAREIRLMREIADDYRRLEAEAAAAEPPDSGDPRDGW
jgi:hypothetical protein